MHTLLRKKKIAMDTVNEALLQPSVYPGAEKDYDSPFYFKGTESREEQIARRSSFRGSRKAEVKMHTEPKFLPPRNELRSHLDDEVKKELKAEKEGSVGTIELTPEQDKFWVRTLEFHMNNGKPEATAVRLADAELTRKWPELSKYKHWADPA